MLFKRKPEIRDLLSIIVILCFVALLIWVGFQYNKTFGEIKGSDLASSAENLRELIKAYGDAGVFVMIFLHTIQVIVSFIPAALMQFAGAAIYGLGIGMLIGIVGVAAGSSVSFYISRFFGRRVVTLFVSEKTLDKLEIINSKGASRLALLILFIIPFPKDFLAYFIGLTKMKASTFFLISTVGRLPGMLVASYLGAHIFDRNYIPLIVVSAVTVVSFLLAYLFRGRIMAFVSKKR